MDELLNQYPYKNRPDYIIRDLYLNNWLFGEYISLHEVDSILDIMRALVLGYEPKVTPEKHIKKIWDQNELVCDFSNGIREGIKQTLFIHDIKYDWLEGAE